MNSCMSEFQVCSLRESASLKGISLGTPPLVEEGLNFGHGRGLIMGMAAGTAFSPDCVAHLAQSENRDHMDIILGWSCSLYPERREASEDAAPLLRPRTLLRFDPFRYGTTDMRKNIVVERPSSAQAGRSPSDQGVRGHVPLSGPHRALKSGLLTVHVGRGHRNALGEFPPRSRHAEWVPSTPTGEYPRRRASRFDLALSITGPFAHSQREKILEIFCAVFVRPHTTQKG
jgi:hypothetical protein